MGKKGSLEGKTIYRNDDARKVRAAAILSRRVFGSTNTAIGQEFGISPDTVKRELQYAAKVGLVEKAEEEILKDLVPLAVDAYRKALNEGDLFVAKDVLWGMGVLKKTQERPAQGSNPTGDLTLEAYLKIKGEKGAVRDALLPRATGDGERGGFITGEEYARVPESPAPPEAIDCEVVEEGSEEGDPGGRG